DFYGHGAAQKPVARPVDDGHPAFSDPFEKLVSLIENQPARRVAHARGASYRQDASPAAGADPVPRGKERPRHRNGADAAKAPVLDHDRHRDLRLIRRVKADKPSVGLAVGILGGPGLARGRPRAGPLDLPGGSPQ